MSHGLLIMLDQHHPSHWRAIRMALQSRQKRHFMDRRLVKVKSRSRDGNAPPVSNLVSSVHPPLRPKPVMNTSSANP